MTVGFVSDQADPMRLHPYGVLRTGLIADTVINKRPRPKTVRGPRINKVRIWWRTCKSYPPLNAIFLLTLNHLIISCACVN